MYQREALKATFCCCYILKNETKPISSQDQFCLIFNIASIKRKVEVSRRIKLEAKAAKSAAALPDRLVRCWDSLWTEVIY